MIYCVEDDGSIRDLVVYTLNISGFEAKGFPESTSFWEAMGQQRPQLVILDIMLPGEDGLAILKKLRDTTSTAGIPVIMATAKGTEYDKVMGLDLGADDYLTKPFGMMEMLSRIKAVLRRTAPQDAPSVLNHRSIELDKTKHRVFVDGREVSLTLKEYDLLKLFMENVGQVFSRDQLLTSVWGAEYVGETRTVDVHIGTLRTKLGPGGDAIRTVRGVGYRMEDEVE